MIVRQHCNIQCTTEHSLQCTNRATTRLVVLESGLRFESGLKSIFAGLGLGLGKICNSSPPSIFTVHICSVLFRPYDILPIRIVHTTEDFRRYLLNIYCGITHDCVVLTVACSAACSSSVNKGQQSAIYIVINILLLVDTAIKDLDSDLESCSFS